MAVAAQDFPRESRLLDLAVLRFPLAVVIYFAAQTVRRLVEPHTLGLDEAEQLVMTQAFAWGYGSQPPLYSWLQMAMFGLLGQSVLALAVLKNAIIALTFLFAFATAERVLGDRLKAVAVTLSLFLIPQIAWESQRALVHTPFVVAAAAGTLLSFLILVEKRRTLDYALFGAAIGVGVLAKYSFPLFAAALLSAALTTPRGRRAILDRRMFALALPISLAATSPTLLWSFANLDLLLARTWKFGDGADAAGSAAWPQGAFELAKDVVSFSILCVAAFLATAFLFRRGARAGGPGELSPRAGSAVELSLEQRRIVLLTPVFCLAALLLFLLASGATEFKDRWLQPYLFVLPLACFILLEHRLGPPRQIVLAGIGGSLALAAMLGLVIYNQLPDLQRRPSHVTAPFAAIAGQIRALGFSRGTIISQNSYISGNLLFRFPEARSLTAEYSRMPLRYEPPILLAWQGDLAGSRRREIEAAFGVVCAAPLPEKLAAAPVRANHIGSRRHVHTLNVAILPACPG